MLSEACGAVQTDCLGHFFCSVSRGSRNGTKTPPPGSHEIPNSSLGSATSLRSERMGK